MGPEEDGRLSGARGQNHTFCLRTVGSFSQTLDLHRVMIGQGTSRTLHERVRRTSLKSGNNVRLGPQAQKPIAGQSPEEPIALTKAENMRPCFHDGI